LNTPSTTSVLNQPSVVQMMTTPMSATSDSSATQSTESDGFNASSFITNDIMNSLKSLNIAALMRSKANNFYNEIQ
jgi:hypothetical protein